MPNMAKNTRLMAAVADENVGFLKNRRSSIGCSARSSQAAKSPSTARPDSSGASVAGAVQPWFGPSMMPYSRAPRPTIDSPAPTGSRRSAFGSFDVGTSTRPPISAAATRGMLTRNTDPHQKCSSRKPLATGPMAAPAPARPAHRAMALARSWGGKTLVRIDSVAGMIRAAPIPMTARRAMS